MLSLGLSNWSIILGLGLGGLLAALIGAWACKRIPVKPFMILLGVLVIALSVRTMLKHQGVI